MNLALNRLRCNSLQWMPIFLALIALLFTSRSEGHTDPSTTDPSTTDPSTTDTSTFDTSAPTPNPSTSNHDSYDDLGFGIVSGNKDGDVVGFGPVNWARMAAGDSNAAIFKKGGETEMLPTLFTADSVHIPYRITNQRNVLYYGKNLSEYMPEGNVPETFAHRWRLGADANENGLPDDWEEYYGIAPTHGKDADLDGDGLTNYQEWQLRLDPMKIDTDGNGIPDSAAKFFFNDPSYTPDGDFDGDGVSNLNEILEGVSPTIADRDRDGLSDAREIALGLNPDAADSDGDGWDDLFELENNFNPLNRRDGGLDQDGDGLSDGFELVYGTDPNNYDSDGDGRSDGYEIALDSDPNDPGDGLFVATGPVVVELWSPRNSELLRISE